MLKNAQDAGSVSGCAQRDPGFTGSSRKMAGRLPKSQTGVSASVAPHAWLHASPGRYALCETGDQLQ